MRHRFCQREIMADSCRHYHLIENPWEPDTQHIYSVNIISQSCVCNNDLTAISQVYILCKY